jgi:hypothetical protein
MIIIAEMKPVLIKLLVVKFLIKLIKKNACLQIVPDNDKNFKIKINATTTFLYSKIRIDTVLEYGIRILSIRG